jgi:hypothetical protein
LRQVLATELQRQRAIYPSLTDGTTELTVELLLSQRRRDTLGVIDRSSGRRDQ